MKTNKLKKCILSNSENFNEIINQPQVVSNTNLNHQFWQSLKDTINTKKESQSIKGRIFTAKRILTPIIQELMRDALEQIEAEDAEEVKRGKEVKVLYNNIRANDIWHVQTDVLKDGEEWAMRILREISRDFEQPFDKLHEKVSGNEDEEPSPKDILLNKKLLKKLVAIHLHLANIIERLKERCKPKRNIEDDNDSLNNLRNQGINVETSSSRDTQCYSALTNQKKRNSKAYDVNIQSSRNQHEEFSTKSTSIYDYNLVVKENKDKLLVENACSPINFGELEKAGFSISKKLLYDVAVSYHALFEENRNNIGNKEIVIKCLEDLEKVRNYLEAMRDNKECEKPKFTDLESCNNYACLESQPHLHSNLHNMPMVLKLNKHAEENERNSDLIIGIPSLTKSSPDVHILLNTKNQHVDIKEAPEQSNRHQNHHKNACRVSRIPKPIHKKRIDMGRYLKSNSMRITLENKDSPRRNAANLLIFDPDDPCKSIIKMKEQKSEDQSDSRSVVSNNRCKVKYQEVLIVKFVFCCIGGKCISIWFLTEWFLDIKYFSEKYSLIHLLQRRVSMVILNFSLILTKIPDEHFLKYEVNDRNCPCVKKINSRRQSPKAIECCYDGYLDNYINNLLNFISTIKGSLKHTPSKEGRCHKQILYPEYNFDLYRPQRGAFYATYFFECFKENKEKVNTEPSSQSRWDAQTENRTAYPMWTIKRSKYYSVPQSKKRTEVVLEQKLAEDEQQENMDQLKLEEVDSLENIGGSHNEIHMQISQVSVHSTELNKAEDLDADIDKSCKKTEIKRKVSFREEVDVSGAGVDPDPPQDQDLYSQDFQNLPDSPNEGQAHFHDMKNALEESPSLDTRENMKKLSSRISDLLMTDSLMQIAEKISKSDTKKLKQSSKRSSPKSLKLTNSARNVLAKLSKSFEDEEYRSVSGTLDSDLAKQFYDKEGNPIAEVYNSEGDLLFKMKENNIHKLTSVLFDSDGLILKNRYDVDSKRIKTVYDENGTAIRRIQLNDEDFKGVQADLETVEYYDYKGKPIKHLYDSSGYEINTVGKDLTSRIFDADGRLQNDIFTKRGRKIDAVYDSDGRLLARVSESQLEPVLRRQQVRVAKMDDDSLNKLFDGGCKSVKFENGDLLKQSESPKRLFDQEGNPLTGVYDKKGKPIKLTSSGEADELLPFLFDNNGKLQSKRFDSKGKELKAVFGEDGKAISEMSIAWLNELLANSKETEVKSKKKESFFKRITKPKTKTERQCNIEKLYDSNGKIITSIFDAKGKPLAVTLSGDANKLIPFLFDTGGKFIKKRYDSEKHKLRCVYGRDGNTITNVSVTYLDQIAAKLEKEQNQKTEENSFQIEDDGNWNLPKVSQEPVGNMLEETKSEKNLDCFDRVPDQIYDEEGNILTEIFDHEGNILVNSSSGNAWKLLPHLFDHEGNFLKKRFDQKGRELFGVYNKDGENLNKDLSKAIKITVGKTYSPHEEIEYHEERNDNIEDVGKKCESNTSIERVDKIDMKQNEKKKKKRRRNKSNEKIKMRDSLLNLRKRGSSIVSVDNTSKHSMMKKTSSTSKQVESFQKKEKHEKKQLKPTTSITKKQSINQRFDIPEVKPKAGESIDRFYDERGNPIMEVYDSKGRALIRTKSGDVDQLAKILFDKKGFLLDHLYDRKGRRIKQIFDQQKRSISRISMPCIISGDNSSMKEHQNDERIPGSVYDKEGNLVKEIFDKRRHPIIFTRLAKLEDLAPIIFDEKGVRRRVFDKSGYEIGPVYDHKGKEIKKLPVFKKSRPKPNNTDTRIFSKSGRPLRNLYDSEGTLIIALYNDYGKTLCNVKKGSNNVEVLSKFFFDKEGHFLRGRFYNFRGQMIRHIYDSDNNIIRHIQRTESRKIAHHKSSNRGGDRNQKKHANKLNLKINAKASNHIPRGYHGRSEVRPVENIMGTFSSQSDTILNPAAPLVQRSMSAYSLGDYPKRYPIALSSTSSTSSLTDMPIKKFYDEHGRLLTGVYNSKTRLLGYTASGNARVLAPYLFDIKGKFLPGRYNLDRKPLKHIYDSNGKLIEKLSNPVVNKNKEKVPKQPKGFKFHDLNGDAITSVYDVRGDKILDVTGSCDKIVNLFDKNGKFKKHLYNYRGSRLKVYEENRKVVKKVSSEEVNSDPGSDVSEERDEDYPSESKGRFSALSNFKDKILTVIFDNQQRLSQRISIKTPKRRRYKRPEGNVNKIAEESRKKQKRSHLYDKNTNVISDIYDDRGERIKKLYNPDGKVIEDLYSASGTLVKNKVLRNMFEKNVFKPKAFDSEGNIITTIYANKKALKKVYDENGEPARLDSDLVYLVSKQSLPDDKPALLKPAPKQVNYFSEGSTYPFPEGQNQNSQIKNQQLIKELNYETEMEVAFNGYPRRRTDDCTCENCQKLGNNRKNIVQFGGELLNRLSRFTIPLSKFLPRNFLRRYEDFDDTEGEVDSLETFIDQAGKQDVCVEAEEYYGNSPEVRQESDENVPISRKMIENTLKNCVHFNSSTNAIGKVSDTVLQHFANLILHEIEQKFYHKLNILQYSENHSEDSSHVFQCDDEKDICIGTELKFEDELIGKHNSAQTTDILTGKCHICESSLESFDQNPEELYGYYDPNSIGPESVDDKAFVCKVPNLQPFIMTMKSKIRKI